MSDRPNWAPDTWKRFEALYQPEYEDLDRYDRVLERIRGLPPLVMPAEVEELKQNLVAAGRGEAFVLQGGNCAETFSDCNSESIANKLRILLQMSLILRYGTRKPVVRIGRIAGQYAKPRTVATETIGGEELPTYRGDAVNSWEPTQSARRPDPQRLLDSYFHAASVLNHIRALLLAGFADLHHPFNWNVVTSGNCEAWAEYEGIVERILDAIDFMESIGGVRGEALGKVDFYTSHEGLLLGFEEAMTRKDEETGGFYDLSAHLPWIGARTIGPGSAHVEFFRGVRNPVGVKVGPDAGPEIVIPLLEALNPDNEEGRVVLITRLGAGRVEELLPSLVRSVVGMGMHVVWSCDPMHGNTVRTADGVKTRDFSVILDELTRTHRLLGIHGAHLGGVHFELTAQNVTECIGGAEDLTSADLNQKYQTYCDPRLNNSQSLQIAFQIARMLGV